MATILMIFWELAYQISCSLNSIKAIPKMLCFVTIHWSELGPPKCMVPQPPDRVPVPLGPSCSAANAYITSWLLISVTRRASGGQGLGSLDDTFFCCKAPQSKKLTRIRSELGYSMASFFANCSKIQNTILTPDKVDYWTFWHMDLTASLKSSTLENT